MLARFFASFAQLMVASLVIGAGLSTMHISMADILARFGLTPDRAAELVVQGFWWALPNIVLGSIVVVPTWLLINLFRPPSGYE